MRFREPPPPDYAAARSRLRAFFLAQAVESGNHDLRELADAISGVPDGDLILGALAVHLGDDDQAQALLATPSLIDFARSYRAGQPDPIIWLSSFGRRLIDVWAEQPLI